MKKCNKNLSFGVLPANSTLCLLSLSAASSEGLESQFVEVAVAAPHRTGCSLKRTGFLLDRFTTFTALRVSPTSGLGLGAIRSAGWDMGIDAVFSAVLGWMLESAVLGVLVSVSFLWTVFVIETIVSFSATCLISTLCDVSIDPPAYFAWVLVWVKIMTIRRIWQSY